MEAASYVQQLYDLRMDDAFNAISGTDRIELMQTFIRIVEAGSLSAAAARLGTTQPTVSRRLQALERALGLKLMKRSTHGMGLTDDGARCHAHARDLLDTWRAMEADLRGAHAAPQGILRVLVPHAFGQDQLIAPLADYLNAYPEVRVEWLLQDRQPDFVAEGIDCAIQVGDVDDPRVVALRLAEVPRIVVGAPRLLGGAAPLKQASELASLPWLALRTYYRDEVVLSGPKGALCRFPIRPRMATDSLYALRNAATAGLGVAILSSWLVEPDLAAGTLVHIAPAWRAAPLPVHLVYPHARFYPARLMRFLEVMRAAMPGVAGMRSGAD